MMPADLINQLHLLADAMKAATPAINASEILDRQDQGHEHRHQDNEPAASPLVLTVIGSEPTDHRRRRGALVRVAIGLAAAIVGLLVVPNWTRNDNPAADAPSTDPISAVVDAAPAPTGALLRTAFPVDQTPLVLTSQPDWTLSYVHSNEDMPGGEMWTGRTVLVGDGPRYDSPWFAVITRPADQYDLSAIGAPVMVGAIQGRIEITDADSTTHLVGPTISVIWPIPGDRIAYAMTVRMSKEQALEMAAAVTIVDGTASIEPTDGFTRLQSSQPDTWRLFEYQYTSGNKRLQLNGSNLGVDGLFSRIGSEVRTTRTIDDVEIAYRPLPDSPGTYWADWQVGEWSYYSMAEGLASEDEFLALLSSMQIVDNSAFITAAGSLSLLQPGDHSAFVANFVQGIALPPNTPTDGWSTTALTTEFEYTFSLMLGLGCGWSET